MNTNGITIRLEKKEEIGERNEKICKFQYVERLAIEKTETILVCNRWRLYE